MMQGSWLHTVVEVISCVLMSILCGCGPSPSGEPGAAPGIAQPAGQGGVASSPPLVVPDWIATAPITRCAGAASSVRCLGSAGTHWISRSTYARLQRSGRTRAHVGAPIDRKGLASSMVALGIRDKSSSGTAQTVLELNQGSVGEGRRGLTGLRRSWQHPSKQKRSLCTNKLKNSLGMTAMSSSTLQPSLGSELRPTAMDARSTNNLLTKRC